MAERFEDQPWYREWHERLERVISAQMRREAAQAGTAERAAADAEFETAMAAFREIANRVR